MMIQRGLWEIAKPAKWQLHAEKHYLFGNEEKNHQFSPFLKIEKQNW